MRATASYDEPFAWWGPVWSPPAPRNVLDLIRDGTLPVETAALLWALLARRASLAVAAGPSGAGKTTLLTALLDFLPPATNRLYLRGCYEPFAFLADPTVDPTRTTLLVNEISANLPAYLWGPGVRRALAATGRGFALLTTLHATSPTELVRDLAGYPLRVPTAEIAHLGVVVVLEAWSVDGAIRRGVATVAVLTPTRGGLAIESLAARSTAETQPAVDLRGVAGVSARFGWRADGAIVAREIASRAALLTALAAAPPADLVGTLARLGRRWLGAPAVAEEGRRPPPAPPSPW